MIEFITTHLPLIIADMVPLLGVAFYILYQHNKLAKKVSNLQNYVYRPTLPPTKAKPKRIIERKKATK